MLAVTAEDAHRLEAELALDDDGDVARRHRQRVAELAVEDLGEIARALDERVVAVAGRGEPLHQVLVVVEAEADGR